MSRHRPAALAPRVGHSRADRARRLRAAGLARRQRRQAAADRARRGAPAAHRPGLRARGRLRAPQRRAPRRSSQAGSSAGRREGTDWAGHARQLAATRPSARLCRRGRPARRQRRPDRSATGSTPSSPIPSGAGSCSAAVMTLLFCQHLHARRVPDGLDRRPDGRARPTG